jgi:hypothetical protein
MASGDRQPIRRDPNALPTASGLLRTDTQHGLTVTRLRPALEPGQRLGVRRTIGEGESEREITILVRSAEVSRRAPLKLDVLNVGTQTGSAPKLDFPFGDK